MSTLPVIPEVHFVCTKADQTEEFESWRDLLDWVLDCFDKDVAATFRDVSADGQTGCEGYTDWLQSYGEMEDVSAILAANGWAIDRKAA